MQRKYPKLREAPRHEDCVMCDKPDAVLCHRNIPKEDEWGKGLKIYDWWGAWLCFECHTYGDNDGRYDAEWWERAVFRTIKRLINKGLIRI